jgi:hypothetical protein
MLAVEASQDFGNIQQRAASPGPISGAFPLPQLREKGSNEEL